MSLLPKRRILGVDFFTGSLSVAVDTVIGGGGAGQRVTPYLVVAPSAPGLGVELVHSPVYREALTSADLALTDSSFMVVLWWLLTGERVPRYSGLLFMRAVLARPELKSPGAVFWVMPSAAEDVRNREWLVTQGFPVTPADVYLAPFYGRGEIEDPALIKAIEARKPRMVMLAIGGGVQERLGLMLRRRLTGAPSVLCLGAAIGFLSGTQTAIPVWADKLMLGMLFRFVGNPRRYWRRYWEGIQLAPLMHRYRDRQPRSI